MTAHALGIDPGPTKTAASWMRLDDEGHLHIEIGGHYENESPDLRRLIQRAAMERAPIGIEQIVGFAYEAKRVAALVETARWEGRFAQLAIGFGASVGPIEARSWRGLLCGSPTASDKQVRIAIEGLVKTIPHGPAAAREHLYDATGVAIATLSKALGRAVSVPARVMALVQAQRDQERAARGAKKSEGVIGSNEKRAPTRAQSARRSEAAKKAWRAKA